MKPQDHCPTCGSSLGALHDKNVLHRCSSCNQPNPRGFYYCGFCAAPMETSAHRAELADVAAPPGGWPSLSRELVEVRFYIDRGELDEAYELLAILRERHPGHPALVEFARRAGGPRPDTQVHRVVDSVLADSSALNSAMPRRAVPQWNAPAAGEGKSPAAGQTQSHGVVPVEPSEGAPAPGGVRKRVARVDDERQAGSFPVVPVRPSAPPRDSTDVQAVVPPVVETPAKSPRAQTDKHLGAIPREVSGGPVEHPAPDEPEPLVVEAVDPAAPAQPEPAAPVAPVHADPAEASPDNASSRSHAPTPATSARSRRRRHVVPSRPQAPSPSTTAHAPPSNPATSAAVARLELRPAAPPLPSTSADVEPEPGASRGGMTVAVPSLQPPAPFDRPATPEAGRRSRGGARKRALKSRKRSGKQVPVVEASTAEPAPGARKKRGDSFGQHVLGRLGGKGKGGSSKPSG